MQAVLQSVTRICPGASGCLVDFLGHTVSMRSRACVGQDEAVQCEPASSSLPSEAHKGEEESRTEIVRAQEWRLLEQPGSSHGVSWVIPQPSQPLCQITPFSGGKHRPAPVGSIIQLAEVHSPGVHDEGHRDNKHGVDLVVVSSANGTTVPLSTPSRRWSTSDEKITKQDSRGRASARVSTSGVVVDGGMHWGEAEKRTTELDGGEPLRGISAAAGTRLSPSRTLVTAGTIGAGGSSHQGLSSKGDAVASLARPSSF